jgi:25S rRNA (uracil2843-N3)-methyltransferase
MKKGKPAPKPKSNPIKARNEVKNSNISNDKAVFARQQRLLTIFSDTFRDTLLSDTFDSTVQEIKGALYDRNFALAFGSAPYLETYAARWSPTRSLAYAEILSGLHQILLTLSDKQPPNFRVVAVGGGAAEVVTFASLVGAGSSLAGAECELSLVDTAPWGSVVSALYHGVTTPPVLSKYASGAVKAANSALVSAERLTVAVERHDVLAADFGDKELGRILGPAPVLVTFFFTLNELMHDRARAASFLLELSARAAVGSLLLIVDSPGSYAESAVGEAERTYPMLWLFERIVSADRDWHWEKLVSEDSLWFRLPERLNYPIKLENMRYQMHLYRNTGKADD